MNTHRFLLLPLVAISIISWCGMSVAAHDREKERTVSLKKVPNAVKATILRELLREIDELELDELEKEKEDGEVLYEAEIEFGEKEIELEIRADGKLISKEVTLEDDEEEDGAIAVLQDWTKRATATHELIKKLRDQGVQGGEPQNELLTRYQLLIAKARLASAQGQGNETKRLWKEAVAVANEYVEVANTAYQSGQVTLEQLVAVQERYAEASIELHRLHSISSERLPRPDKSLSEILNVRTRR